MLKVVFMNENESQQLETVKESVNPPQIEVKIDTSSIREEVAETVKAMMEARELEKEEAGKGEVVEPDEHSQEMTELAERLRSGKTLKEQWTVVIPKTTKELAARLRDFVFISPVIKGKQGDTVNIPYVKAHGITGVA